MTRALITVLIQTFYKAIGAIFLINCVALWAFTQPDGISAQTSQLTLIYLWFSAQVFSFGIALRWAPTQQYLYQTLNRHQQGQELSLLRLVICAIAVVQFVPLVIMTVLTQYLYGNVTWVDIIGLSNLMLLLAFPYLGSVMLCDWRHWSTGLVFLGCLPLLGVFNTSWYSQLCVSLGSVVLVLVYVLSTQRGKRVTIASVSTLGFYLVSIAVIGVALDVKTVWAQKSAAQISSNKTLIPFAPPSFLTESHGRFKLDWLNATIKLNPIQSSENTTNLLAKQAQVYSNFESLWREQHRFNLPVTAPYQTEGYDYFLFNSELVEVNLNTGETNSLWQAKNADNVASWHQFVWLNGSTIGGLVWGNENNVHWLTTPSANRANSGVDVTVHSAVMINTPVTVELSQPAPVVLYVYDAHGKGIGYDYFTGVQISDHAKRPPLEATNSTAMLALVSPIHANFLAALFNDSLQVGFVNVFFGIAMVLAIVVAFYYRNNSYRWLKTLSVLALGLPMLLALLAYYPKESSRT